MELLLYLPTPSVISSEGVIRHEAIPSHKDGRCSIKPEKNSFWKTPQRTNCICKYGAYSLRSSAVSKGCSLYVRFRKVKWMWTKITSMWGKAAGTTVQSWCIRQDSFKSSVEKNWLSTSSTKKGRLQCGDLWRCCRRTTKHTGLDECLQQLDSLISTSARYYRIFKTVYLIYKLFHEF